MQESAIKVVTLGTHLARISRQSEPNMLHHCKSAEAVLRFAKSRGLTTEASIDELNKLSKPFLAGQHTEYPRRIGYNTITDTLGVDGFLQAARSGAPHLETMNRKLQLLTEDAHLNANWRGGYDSSLLQIFAEFRQNIDAMEESSPPENGPVPVFAALTYADPWSMFRQVDPERELASYQWTSRAYDLHQETYGAMSITEATEQLVTTALKALVVRLKVDMSIFEKCSRYRDSTSRVQLMKKMIFLMEKSGTDFLDAEQVHLLGLRINSGCGGRCPDGISSFCDDFIQEVGMLRNKDKLGELPPQVSRLIFAVSGFVASLKKDFIKKHLSRFKKHYEGRTEGSVVLFQMLMLPLGLVGELSTVAHPQYSVQGLSEPTELDSTRVLRRFIEGGTLQFEYGETVSFEPLNLVNLARKLQHAIVKPGSGQDQPVEHMARSATRSREVLEPRPRYGITIDELVVEDFCRQDIIVGPYFQEAAANEFTHANVFFDAITVDENSPPDTRPLIVQIMRDVVLVRLLEISQYVKVHPKFYQNVAKDWKL